MRVDEDAATAAASTATSNAGPCASRSTRSTGPARSGDRAAVDNQRRSKEEGIAALAAATAGSVRAVTATATTTRAA
jgi:hypothetical protein